MVDGIFYDFHNQSLFILTNMNSKHLFAPAYSVVVARLAHTPGGRGSIPCPGIRKGCLLSFYLYAILHHLHLLSSNFAQVLFSRV